MKKFKVDNSFCFVINYHLAIGIAMYHLHFFCLWMIVVCFHPETLLICCPVLINQVNFVKDKYLLFSMLLLMLLKVSSSRCSQTLFLYYARNTPVSHMYCLWQFCTARSLIIIKCFIYRSIQVNTTGYE